MNHSTLWKRIWIKRRKVGNRVPCEVGGIWRSYMGTRKKHPNAYHSGVSKLIKVFPNSVFVIVNFANLHRLLQSTKPIPTNLGTYNCKIEEKKVVQMNGQAPVQGVIIVWNGEKTWKSFNQSSSANHWANF